MYKESIFKKLLALLFCITIFIFFIKSNSHTALLKIVDYINQDFSEESAPSMSDIESDYAEGLWKNQSFINLNGAMAKLLHMRGYYSSIGMYVTDDYYIVSAYPKTSTDYEYEQMLSFKSFLDEQGVNLMYVNQPTKYVDDSLFSRSFGIESYSNRNADLFLQRISDAGIYVIDLREKMQEDGLNVADMFYRTDHHWTTASGLWATQKIAEGLNAYCGYSIDLSLYDSQNYIFKTWENCWLGEQGKKLAVTYIGLDDYTEIKPNFPTSYTFITKDDGQVDGTFDDFIDETRYNTESDISTASSWHYSYSRRNCVNNNAKYGKVLLLADSFAQVTQPFISLGVGETYSLILRGYDDSFDLRQYIIENEFDTVLICYAQFMIGAHDDPNNVNHRMFTFE